MTDLGRYRREIRANLEHWREKPVLRLIYRNFYEIVAVHLVRDVPGDIVELGSGIPDIREVIPGCIRTDLFDNPRIDRVENAYRLSFPDGTVSNLILFDVFHHLQYPGTALEEFRRVLAPAGRILIFEPCISILGLLVYGLFHREPLGLNRPIVWHAPSGWSWKHAGYYAAQGNAYRIFLRGEWSGMPRDLRRVHVRRMSAVSYVASGGYTGPRLYPNFLFPLMRRVDTICDRFPRLFATRLLAVLQKDERMSLPNT